jgi:hypothetical protein
MTGPLKLMGLRDEQKRHDETLQQIAEQVTLMREQIDEIAKVLRDLTGRDPYPPYMAQK